MQHANLTKDVLMTPPQLKDNGAPAGITWADTQSWSHLRCRIIVGTTDKDMTAAAKMTESDTTGGSYTDITSAALANAVLATEDDKIFAIDVDLTKTHKRYIKCALTAGDGTTGTNLCVLGTLSRPDKTIGSAANAGLQELISA